MPVSDMSHTLLRSPCIVPSLAVQAIEERKAKLCFNIHPVHVHQECIRTGD